MGLERYLSKISDVMAPALGDELNLSHGDDEDDTTVIGFQKWKSSTQDPYDKPTKRQKIPMFRIQIPVDDDGVPIWAEEELIGDRITGLDGKVWTVLDVDGRPSGWTDLFVSDRG